MSDDTSVTSFNQLPTETILDIFEYLSSNDIIYTFFDLNQRFHSILLIQQPFSKIFLMTKKNFHFWKDVLPIFGFDIHHLIITTNGFWFSIDLFPNLKSLVISSSFPIHFDRLYIIMKTKIFKNLISLKIQCKLFHDLYGCEELQENLFKIIFNNNNSLEIFEHLFEIPLYNYDKIDNFIINTNIQSLSLNLINFINVFSLIEYTPNLKYLNLLITKLHDIFPTQSSLNLSNIKLETFIVTFKLDEKDNRVSTRYFLCLINYIKQFSTSLIYLSMDLSQIRSIETNTFHFNGISLQHQLLESMIYLKTFHLYIRLSGSFSDIENILSTFQNQFWFEHDWSFGMHNRYLYTLPFHFRKLYNFTSFNDMKSNNPTLLHSSHTWRYVQSIDLIQLYSVDLIEHIKMRIPNLRSIHLIYSHDALGQICYKDLSWDMSKVIDKNIKLERITTVHFESECIENIKPWLEYILPNVKNLVLSYCPNPVQFFCGTRKYLEKLNQSTYDKRLMESLYFSNIQNVEMKFFLHYATYVWEYVLDFIDKIVEIFRNVQLFIFEFNKHNCYPYFDLTENVNNMINWLNMNKILRTYQINRISNSLQLKKRQQ